VLFAEVVDVAAGVFEDSQAEESEHRDECEVAAFGDCFAAVGSASNCR